jgi:hypothetical protein
LDRCPIPSGGDEDFFDPAALGSLVQYLFDDVRNCFQEVLHAQTDNQVEQRSLGKDKEVFGGTWL